MDTLTWQEQAFAALFTLEVLLGSVRAIAGIGLAFKLATERIERWVDEIVGEWADHD